MFGRKMDEWQTMEWVKASCYAFAAFFVLMTGCKSFFSVHAGQVGVTFNSITGHTAARPQGMWAKIPWIESVHKFDVKTQKEEINADSASKDLQKVIIKVVINYHLDYTKVNDLFVKVGADYVEKIIHPALLEAIKAASAKFPVEQIIVARETLKQDAEDLLRDRLKAYNIILESVNLVNISFDEKFNEVVEQKQIEEQRIKTAEYQKLQARELKEKTILEAQAEAAKQALLRNAVSRDVISLKWIEKWDGKLPVYMLGDKTQMLMQTHNP